MDLTSLSSNLPRSASDDVDNTEEPTSAILMSAFKQAALSVTQLYKTAAEQADRSRRAGRSEGYNECLEDLLGLLNRLEGRPDLQNLEAIKQWTLSRRRKTAGGGGGGSGGGAGGAGAGGGGADNTTHTQQAAREQSMESDSSPEITLPAPRSSSPAPPPSPEQQPAQLVTSIPQGPPPRPTTASVFPPSANQMSMFTFRHEQHLPRSSDMSDPEYADEVDLASPPASPQPNPFQTQQQARPGQPRHPKHLHHQPRTGTKRRYNTMNDFFELAGLEKMKKTRFQ